ncbi:hypothetical protein [Gordoniibacillus kamchatkensis]|uniref:hypothetical protein n=1 Tax=Gordoniibacillus kamchatkensis TaxID=1590651 RepID=UPI00373AF0E6
MTEESIRKYSSDPIIASQLVGYLRPYATARGPQGLDFYKSKENTAEYLDSEYVGFDGIEEMYQTELRGKNGKKTYPVNVLGKITGRVTVTPPQKGNNLYLTIQKDVQLATQQLSPIRSTGCIRPRRGTIRMPNTAPTPRQDTQWRWKSIRDALWRWPAIRTTTRTFGREA